MKVGLFIYYRALHSCDQGMMEMQTHEPQDAVCGCEGLFMIKLWFSAANFPFTTSGLIKPSLQLIVSPAYNC